MSDLVDLMDPHTFLHRQPRDTEVAAARSIEPLSGQQRKQVLAAVRSLGGTATDYEISAATGLQLNSVRPRRLELLQKGFLVETEERRLTPSGRKAIVWGIA